MENTLGNRAKFFAQYWGQEILFYEQDPFYLRIVNTLNICDPENFVAILKPLSSISDEDCEAISKLTQAWDGDILPAEYVEEWLEEILTGNCSLTADYVSGYQAMEVIDFLRSKGYALPYMGLRVETLVSYGWVKITE